MPDITDRPDSEHMYMEDRLELQALKNKRMLDKSIESYEEYSKLDKRELLELLLKSSSLMAMSAEYIRVQRTSLTRLQMDKIQAALE